MKWFFTQKNRTDFCELNIEMSDHYAKWNIETAKLLVDSHRLIVTFLALLSLNGD